MSSLLRLEQQQKRFLKFPFEFEYSSYSFGIETINTFIHSRSSLENHTRFQTKMGSLYSFYDQNLRKGVPPWSLFFENWSNCVFCLSSKIGVRFRKGVWQSELFSKIGVCFWTDSWKQIPIYVNKLRFSKEQIPISVKNTVEPRLTTTSFMRPPRYYGHILSNQT